MDDLFRCIEFEDFQSLLNSSAFFPGRLRPLLWPLLLVRERYSSPPDDLLRLLAQFDPEYLTLAERLLSLPLADICLSALRRAAVSVSPSKGQRNPLHKTDGQCGVSPSAEHGPSGERPQDTALAVSALQSVATWGGSPISLNGDKAEGEESGRPDDRQQRPAPAASSCSSSSLHCSQEPLPKSLSSSADARPASSVPACPAGQSAGRHGLPPASLAGLSPDSLLRSFASDLYAVLCRGRTPSASQEGWISLLPLLVSVLLFHISPAALDQVSKYAGKARSKHSSLVPNSSVKAEQEESGAASQRTSVKRHRVQSSVSLRSSSSSPATTARLPAQAQEAGGERTAEVSAQAGSDQSGTVLKQDGESSEASLKQSDKRTLKAEKKETEKKEKATLKESGRNTAQTPGFLKTAKSNRRALLQGVSVARTKRFRSSLPGASSSHSVEDRRSAGAGASSTARVPSSESLGGLLSSSSSLRALPVLAFAFEVLWSRWKLALRNYRADKQRPRKDASPASGGISGVEVAGEGGGRAFEGGDQGGEGGESVRKANFREVQQFGLQPGDILWNSDENQGATFDKNRVEEIDVLRDTVHAAVFCTGTLELGLQVAESVIDSLLALLSSAQPRSSLVLFSFCQKTFSSLRLISRPFAELLALKLSDSLSLSFAPHTPGPFVVLQLSSFSSADQLHAAVCRRSFPVEALKPYLSLTVFARLLCRLPGTAALKAELLVFFFILHYDHGEAQRRRLVHETRESLREQKRAAALEEELKQRKPKKALVSPPPGTASAAPQQAEEGTSQEASSSSSASSLPSSAAVPSASESTSSSRSVGAAAPFTSAASSTGFLRSRGSRSPPAAEQPSVSLSPQQSRRNSLSSSRSFPPNVFFLGNGQFVLSSEKGFVAHVLLRFIEEALFPSAFSASPLPSSTSGTSSSFASYDAPSSFSASPTSSFELPAATDLIPLSGLSAPSSEASSVPPFSAVLPLPQSRGKLHALQRCSHGWGLLAVAEMIGLLPVQSLSLSLRRLFRLSLPYAVLWALKLTAFTSAASSHYADVLQASLPSSSSLFAPTASSPALPPRTTALVAACEALAFGSFCWSSEHVGGYYSHTSLSTEGASSASLPAEVIADLRQNLALLLFDVDTQALMRPANPLVVQKTLVELLPFAAAYLPWLSDRLGNAMLFDFALGRLLEVRDGDEEDEEVDGGEEDGDDFEEDGRGGRERGEPGGAQDLAEGDGAEDLTRARDEDAGKAEGGRKRKRDKAREKLEKAFVHLVKGSRQARVRAPARERGRGQACAPEQTEDIAAKLPDNAAGAQRPSSTTCLLFHFLFSFARHAVEAVLVFPPGLVTRCHGQIHGGEFHILPYTALQRWLHCVEILTQMLQGLPPPNQAGAGGQAGGTHCWADGTPAPCLTSPLDIPFIFAFLRAHSFPSEADFLGPSNPSGVSSGFSLRGAFRGVLFTDGAVGASEGSLNQQARQWRREGAGVALVLYLIAKLHSVPYFKARDAVCLAKLHSALPWNGFLNFCSSDPLLGHWLLRFVHDALAASLPEVLSVNQPPVPDWRTRLDPSSVSPLVLARASAVGDVRLNQLLSAFSRDGYVGNMWSDVRRTARLAASPSLLRAVGFRGGLPPSALEIFAFGCDNLWRFWADLVPGCLGSASASFVSTADSAARDERQKCSGTRTRVSRRASFSPGDEAFMEESSSMTSPATTAAQSAQTSAISAAHSGGLPEGPAGLSISGSPQKAPGPSGLSPSSLEPPLAGEAGSQSFPPTENEDRPADQFTSEPPPGAAEAESPQRHRERPDTGGPPASPVEAAGTAKEQNPLTSQASSKNRLRMSLCSLKFAVEEERRDFCLLLEAWHLMASAEPAVASACVLIQLISTFVHPSCSVARKRQLQGADVEGAPSEVVVFEKELAVQDTSLLFSPFLLLPEPARKEESKELARKTSTPKSYERERSPSLEDGDENSAVAAHYFNACQNPLNLLLRVPGVVLRRLMALNILPECIYFLLLKMETYLSLGPPVVPDFPRIFFSPEDVFATQEAAVFQVLIEACRDAPSQRGLSPIHLGRKRHTPYGVWELLCRLLDRQQARRPQALQLLFSGGFACEAVNPICRFLSEPQRLLPLLTVALRETAGAIWKASEEAKEKQAETRSRPVVTSYESFVALPASPVSASVHPALPPLTAVDRCIFYLKAIVCVACDLRDNEALRSDDPETNPAFAAESANAVFLEAIKHIDNHASEELCELVCRAVPVAFPLYYLFPKLAVLVNAFLSRRNLLNGEAVVMSEDGGAKQQRMYTGGDCDERSRKGGDAGGQENGPRAACEAMLEQLAEDLRLVVESDVQLRSSAAQAEEN